MSSKMKAFSFPCELIFMASEKPSGIIHDRSTQIPFTLPRLVNLLKEPGRFISTVSSIVFGNGTLHLLVTILPMRVQIVLLLYWQSSSTSEHKLPSIGHLPLWISFFCYITSRTCYIIS